MKIAYTSILMIIILRTHGDFTYDIKRAGGLELEGLGRVVG